MRQVNLVPESLRSSERNKAVRKLLLTSLGPVLFLILLIHVGLSIAVIRLQATANEPPALRETPKVKELRRDIDKLKIQMQGLIDNNKTVIEISARRFVAANILKIVGDVTYGKVWVNGLSLNIQSGSFVLDGSSFNTRWVSEFMLELKRIPYFSAVELITMGKASENEVTFKITCSLK